MRALSRRPRGDRQTGVTEDRAPLNPVTLSPSKGVPVMACDELRRAFDKLTTTGKVSMRYARLNKWKGRPVRRRQVEGRGAET
jgi:hypothetical protein